MFFSDIFCIFYWVGVYVVCMCWKDNEQAKIEELVFCIKEDKKTIFRHVSSPFPLFL